MKKIIKKIMSHPSLVSQPPILMDIGASGFIHKKWNSIAKYSICIAFDADTRDFQTTEAEDIGWRKLIKLNRLVAECPKSEADFYLTQSPHCSSSIPPDEKALEPWAFRDLFNVVKKVKLPAIDVPTALNEIGVDYIDAYKTDSQGTDLRIFRSIPENIQNNIIAAEFEPGIIDAMKGEDKLHALMLYMDTKPFWITNMGIYGSWRISKNNFSSLNFVQKRALGSFLKVAPGWCEISYINTLTAENISLRQHLLSWLFSTLYEEHGFALMISQKGFELFEDPLFLLLEKKSRRKLSSGYLTVIKHVLMRLLRLRFN
jgi:hypothetical protein